MLDTRTEVSVPEDRGRLLALELDRDRIDTDVLLEAIRQDKVVLIRHVAPEEAEQIVYRVAAGFGMAEELALQAGYVKLYRHRHKIGKYSMSVNERSDYQVVPPHSEGSRAQAMQLAAFYCYENSTDGGETILMNVDGASPVWPSLRETVRRVQTRQSRTLTAREILRIRGRYFLNVPDDVIRDDDQVIREHDTDIPGFTVAEVLAKPEKTYSRVLGSDLYVYWDTVSSNDHDSAREYLDFLERSGLLKSPAGGLDPMQIDSQAHRRVCHSGMTFSQLFRCRITVKLAPGDLIIQNNLTWTHAVSNWSPGSGQRTIAASFA
jgi:alpha-ketoglutarate-dependent taurine dioxygenase